MCATLIIFGSCKLELEHMFAHGGQGGGKGREQAFF